MERLNLAQPGQSSNEWSTSQPGQMKGGLPSVWAYGMLDDPVSDLVWLSSKHFFFEVPGHLLMQATVHLKF